MTKLDHIWRFKIDQMIKSLEWNKNAVLTTKGFVDAKTGELLKSMKVSHEDVNQYNNLYITEADPDEENTNADQIMLTEADPAEEFIPENLIQEDDVSFVAKAVKKTRGKK